MCAAFVVDPALLKNSRTGAPLVNAFFTALRPLRAELRERGSDLVILRGDPESELPALCRRIQADDVFFNTDYEPAARVRDERVRNALGSCGVETRECLDHVYFGAGEITRAGGEPYKMFTPYSRAWFARAHCAPRLPYASLRYAAPKLLGRDTLGVSAPVPDPGEYGFATFTCGEVSEKAALRALDSFSAGSGMQRYARERDFPASDATSHLSVHLRAGTIGIRTCLARALENGGHVWANELVWRDFYQMILWNFPHVDGQAFLKKAQGIPWRRSHGDLDAWRDGRTGYPIVDAAMRQLNTTGWMHNRLRMIAASFLTKHLLIDWREGERYFEQRLLDADLAQNNGGWQWAASSGTDAVPYFRIFNPVLQSKKFDADGLFIRSMVPELRALGSSAIHEPWRYGGAPGYPLPIVDHAFARKRALAGYFAAFGSSRSSL